MNTSGKRTKVKAETRRGGRERTGVNAIDQHLSKGDGAKQLADRTIHIGGRSQREGVAVSEGLGVQGQHGTGEMLREQAQGAQVAAWKSHRGLRCAHGHHGGGGGNKTIEFHGIPWK